MCIRDRCTLDEWMVKAPAIVPIQSRFCGMEVYMVVVGFGKLYLAVPILAGGLHIFVTLDGGFWYIVEFI